MQHVIKHELSQDTARRAVERAYESYSHRFAQYRPTARWTSENHCDVTFTVKGVTLHGAIDLKPQEVWMDLDVPLLFRPFKKLAMGIVEKEIDLWLDRAKSGELEEPMTMTRFDVTQLDLGEE